MKPIDLVVTTLKAVTIVNIFLCAYKLWMLAEIGTEVTEQIEIRDRQNCDAMQRKLNAVLSAFEEANKRRVKQYPDLGLPRPNSIKFQNICKRCTKMAQQIKDQDKNFQIPDICLAIYANDFIPTDDWVVSFFDSDGKVKDDPYRDQNKIVVNEQDTRLNDLRNNLKDIRRQVVGPEIQHCELAL